MKDTRDGLLYYGWNQVQMEETKASWLGVIIRNKAYLLDKLDKVEKYSFFSKESNIYKSFNLDNALICFYTFLGP